MARTSIGGGFGGGDVKLDEAALAVFLGSPAGPVGQYVAGLAKRVTAEAKRRAPVGDRDSKLGHRRGHLKSLIGWKLGRDSIGIYADVISPARNSKFNPFTPGGNYSYWNEVPGTAPNHSHLPAWITENEHPYLRPALASIIGSL